MVVRECQCRKYCKAELELMQGLSMVTYQCVVKDILCALPIWVTFLKVRFFMLNTYIDAPWT